MRTLALGKPNSPFFRSVRRALPAFGELIFRSERSFFPPSAVVRFVERHAIDRVLMPNPYGNRWRRACYDALRQKGVEVVASDRGALPDSWFFDGGFNADSPSYRPDAWDLPLDEAALERVRGYLTSLRQTDAALETQGARGGALAMRERLGIGEAKILFVPMQRPGDTVVRYFAGAAGTMDGFVEQIRRLSQALSERGSGQWTVVVKRHPLEGGLPGGLGDDVVEAPSDAHVHDLLELADATLVLNSGVGLLSLIFGNPTFHLGDAFYEGPGLSRSVPDAAALVEALDTATPPLTDSVERFVFHLLDRVYSFGTFETEEVSDRRTQARRRVTRDIRFRELRVLGENLTVPRDGALIVSPVVPWPVRRGSESRVDMMIRAMLASGAQVSLCVLRDDPRDGDRGAIHAALNERYAGLDRLEIVDHPRLDPWPGRFAHALACALDFVALGRQRISNAWTCPRRLRGRVHELVRELRPRVLLVNYAKLGPCLPQGFGGLSVLDTHDDQTALLVEGQRHSRNRLDIVVPLYRASEERMLRRFDRILAINPDEVAHFEAAAPSARVHTIPAFTEGSPPTASPGEAATFDAVFVGSGLSFNVSGLAWFIEEVMPLVREARPGFRLNVVGDVGASARIRKLEDEGIRLAGRVDDLAAAYADSRMVIAPILTGAGMKIKVVEAMASGRPLVATPTAAAGISLVHEESAWVAEDVEGFAEGVLAILQSPELGEELSRRAMSLHTAAHSPEAAALALERALD